MPRSEESRQFLASFEAGLPPPPRLAAKCLVGLDSLYQEWKRDLENYVASGGSLVRIVVAPAGSGKTHLGEAMKAAAAEKGFLVCKVDAQGQRTSGDDLQLYRSFCMGLTVPAQYLGDEAPQPGLRSVLESVAARMDGHRVRDALRTVKLPVPPLRDALVAAVDAVRDGANGHDPGWQAYLSALAGEKGPGTGSLTALRSRHPKAFRHLKKMPGKRDARLWLESLLLALRPLGFPGVMLILDEHDDARRKSLDQSIIQLRQQLDRLAEGHLPGAFVLYLVLDDFPSRVREAHAALDQRLSPLIPAPLQSRLMADLSALRDLSDAKFLEAVAAKLHEVVEGATISTDLARRATALAKQHALRMGGVDTRAFVKAFAQLLGT